MGRRGTRPIQPADQRYESAHLFGAICPARGTGAALAMPFADILDAKSKDNSLENCAAVCIKCHKIKTAKHDIPTAAKTVRQQDKAGNIKTSHANPIRGAGFPKSEKAAYRQPKLSLPYRPLYREDQQ